MSQQKQMIKKGLDLTVSGFFLLLDYAILALVAVITGNGWVYDTKTSLTLPILYNWLMRAVFFYVILYFIKAQKFYIVKERIAGILVTFACLLTFDHYNEVNAEDFRTRFIFLFLWMILWIGCHEDKSVIWKRLVNVFVIIAALSLVFYVFAVCLHVIPVKYETPRVWGTWKPDMIKNYHYLFYQSQYTVVMGVKIWRNTAFFTEGPMMNVGMCTALIAELFMNRRPSRVKTSILVVTILTTISTTGYFCMVLAFTAKFFMQNEKAKRMMRKYLPIAAVIVLVILAALFYFKVVATGNGHGSTMTRIGHIRACFKVFRRNKLTGCGWLNINGIWEYTITHKGISVGMAYFIACGGLLLTAVFLVPYLRDLRDAVRLGFSMEDTGEDGKAAIGRAVFETLFLMLFFFTQICNYPLLWLFIAYINVAERETKVCIDSSKKG